MPNKNSKVFLSSVFFVLGFATVFSLVGILLQTALSYASVEVTVWLGRVGGVLIILFGLFLLGLFTPNFLKRDHKIRVTKKFGSIYATSFVFGAAFAVGWTPCVSAALGAILALASTSAGSAFFLLFAYTLGIGIPFLLVGLFVDRAQLLINKAGKALMWFNYIFGALLVIMGILVFTGELSKAGNFEALTVFLSHLNKGTSIGGNISSLSLINLAVSFLAGLGSFLSPCILPIIPGFLSYLASMSIDTHTHTQ